MAAGSYFIHPSNISRVSYPIGSTSTSSINDVAAHRPIDRPIIRASTCVNVAAPLYTPTMPIGVGAQFELSEPRSIERLLVLKNREITLTPNGSVLESSKLPFPELKFSLLDLSAHLDEELSVLFRHPVKVWMVGRAARHVVAGVDFNDIDLCIYSENTFFNENCLIYKKEHYVFKRIQRSIVNFLVKQLEKTRVYQQFEDFLDSDYLIRSCYLTNRVVFDDGTGCLYSLGGQVDIKVLFALDKPKSIADADGFHISLNSTSPTLQCANGKYWCANETARSVALYRAQCRLFYPHDANGARDLVFRLMLESRQGFELQGKDVEISFNKMINDYPTQELFTNSFCRHQRNHCKDMMSRVIDFLTWVTYAENKALHIQMIASAWLDGSNKLGLSPDVEMPIAILLKKYPEMAGFFLAFLRGHLLLRFAKSQDTSLEAFTFSFMERENKPKEQFGILYGGKYHYLFTGQTPMQIATDFLSYSQAFIKFVETKGGIKQLSHLLTFLGIDISILDRTFGQISLEFTRAFTTSKKLTSILSSQYGYNSVQSLRPFYEVLSKFTKCEDSESLKNTMAEAELAASLLKIAGIDPEIEEFIGSILKREMDPLQCLRAPQIVLKLFCGYQDLLPNFVQLFPNVVAELLRTPTLIKLQSLYAIYESLDGRKLLSSLNKSKLLFTMLQACPKVVFPANHNEIWMDRLCANALIYSFSQQKDISRELIDNYLFALQRLATSQDKDILLAAFCYLENALIWKESHQERLIAIGVDLIRHAATRKSFLLSRHICIALDSMIRNHPTLVHPLIARHAFVLTSILQAAEDVMSIFPNDPIYTPAVYRILHATTSVTDSPQPSLMRLFNTCLMNSTTSLECIELVSQAAIRLLSHPGLLDKSNQTKLFELAFNLLGTFKKDKNLLINSQRIGNALIAEISRHWPERDFAFHLARQQLLERIAHCLLKKEKYQEKIKHRIPAYIHAYSNLEGRVLPDLESITSIHLLGIKQEARSQFISFVKKQVPALLTLNVFVKLQNSLKASVKDEFKESDSVTTTTTVATKVAKPKEPRFDVEKLIQRIDRTILLSQEIGQDKVMQKAFKFVINQMMKLEMELSRSLDTSLNLKLKTNLNRLFKALLESPQTSSAANTYQLVRQMQMYHLISEEETSKTYLALIDKFVHIPIRDSLNYLEILLAKVFKIRGYSLKDLDEKTRYTILEAYELVFKNEETFDTEKAQIIHHLFKESTCYNNKSLAKLAFLGYDAIVRCLKEENEDHFAFAISTLHQLIDTGLIDNIPLNAEFEVLSAELISKLPKSWKQGKHNQKLRGLFQVIQSRGILSNLSISTRFVLMQLMEQSDNQVLMDSASLLLKQSIEKAMPGHSDIHYFLQILKKGIAECHKEDNTFEIQLVAESIRQNWDLIKAVFVNSKWHKRFYNDSIRIYIKTENLHYHKLACDIFINESQAISALSFKILLKGFLKLSIDNHKMVKKQLLEVINPYLRYVRIQKNSPHISAAELKLQAECRNLLLTFLDKFSNTHGHATESIEALSFVFQNFDIRINSTIQGIRNKELIHKILSGIRDELVHTNKMNELATFCSFVCTYLDGTLKESLLTPLNKILQCFKKGRSEQSDYKLVMSPQKLLDVLPLYQYYNPERLVGFIKEILKDQDNKPDYTILAKIFIEADKLGIFRKCTKLNAHNKIVYWDVQEDLILYRTRLPSLLELYNKIWEGLLQDSPLKFEDLKVKNEFLFHMLNYKEISPSKKEEILAWIKNGSKLREQLFKHFLSTGNSRLLIDHMSKLFTDHIQVFHQSSCAEHWDIKITRDYFNSIEAVIYVGIKNSFALKEIGDLAAKSKNTPSHITAQLATKNKSTLITWNNQINKSPIMQSYQEIHPTAVLTVMDSYIPSFDGDQFNRAVTAYQDTLKLATTLFFEYVSFGSKLAKEPLLRHLRQLIIERRNNLLEFILDHILCTPSGTSSTFFLESLKNFGNSSPDHIASSDELLVVVQQKLSNSHTSGVIRRRERNQNVNSDIKRN